MLTLFEYINECLDLDEWCPFLDDDELSEHEKEGLHFISEQIAQEVNKSILKEMGY